MLSLMMVSASILAQQVQQPPPAYVQEPMPYPAQPLQRKPSFLRELFAGTIGAILQGTGGGVAAALVQGLTGTIVSWFSKKQHANAYPGPNGYPSEPQFFDPRTGQVSAANAQAYYSRDTVPDNTLVAGVAYEVHALAQGGTAIPVNPAIHSFRTGDRFVVHFRPSMPGSMDVYNINPLGQQTRIDSVRMAAGQLMTLGPYEFTATRGEDALRLVLMPCARNDLIVATRNIVNVAADPAAAPPNGFSLSSCDAPITRSINTRDITKVAVDGTTSFALDPISAQEYASGQLDAREVTVVFHHQ